MQNYSDLLRRVLHTAKAHPDRTGTGRRSIFGPTLTHDLSTGFPVLTGKKVNWQGAIAEMLWFMSGSTNVADLRALGSNIWNEWELPDGTIGPGYGHQLRTIRYSQRIDARAPRAALVSRSPNKVFGIGTYGDITKVPERFRALLMNEWLLVLSEVSPSRYMLDNWFCFELFARDIMKAPGWALKLEKPAHYRLTNRFRYATRYWGPDTVSWVSAEEIAQNSENFSRISGKAEQRDRSLDQLATLVAGLKHDPHSSRHVISLWNPHDLDRMSLPPCHGNIIQCYVRDGEYLDLLQHQRSADLFLGVPFNLVGYAFLTHVLALEVGLKPGILQINLGDAHIYDNHVTQAAQYLAQPQHDLPTIVIDKQPIGGYSLEDVRLLNYKHGPRIGAPVSV